MSQVAAQAAMSPRFGAVAVMSGNWFGVQVKTGMSRAATLAQSDGSQAGLAHSVSARATMVLTPSAFISARRSRSSPALPHS